MDQNAKQPGHVIRELLEKRGWTQTDLARILGRPIPTVNEIIQGKRAIMPEVAMALAAALGEDAQYWLALEINRQLASTEDASAEVRKRARLYELAPIKELQKRGWIRETDESD